MRNASGIVKGFVRFACVFALVMIGFAHKPVAATPFAVDMAAYQLPDGSYASICFDDHGSKPQAVHNTGCEFCRLTNAILLPDVPGIGGLSIAFAEEVKVVERRLQLTQALYPPSSGPRAPPAISMFI